MATFKEYFRGWATGLKSLATGMGTSMKVFRQKPVTEEYPENRHTTLHIPERHRGRLRLVTDENGQPRCIACGLCQMNCPNGTIQIEADTVETPEGRKRKQLKAYHYDLGSCLYCQLCVEACPHGAIEFSNDFENAVFERDRLRLDLTKPEDNRCHDWK